MSPFPRKRFTRWAVSTATGHLCTARIAIGSGSRPLTYHPRTAFWSVTLYGDEGFLVGNPLDRYTISERTPGLVRRPDGGIDVAIESSRPRDEAHVNWLPAPDGPFYLMLRLYLPRVQALDGSWQPPPIERLPADPPIKDAQR